MSKRNENASKLNKSRRHTIDEFLSKLERDHFEMELSYGKLFAELGYAFVSEPIDDEVFEKEDSDYNEFNQRLSSTLDEVSPVIKSNESANQSQMDKIKHTLDDLKARINVMRKKFRQYTINLKRNAQHNRNNMETSDEGEEDEGDDEGDNEDFFKLCVYVKEQAKIYTFKVNRKCRIRELKQILYEKISDQKELAIDDLILTFNGLELSNDSYSISDYAIGDNSTIHLEFDERS